ncbi:MAG TPA: chemotaxis protein CheW [Abditibacteriaceae bacterium]|jgi:hypothetical protein
MANNADSIETTEEKLNSKNSSTILRERMLRLAAPLQDESLQGGLEIVVFWLAGERYAFETSQVREVFALADATQIVALPGTPPWMQGILNVRGHILAVLDLQRLFGLPSPSQDATSVSGSTASAAMEAPPPVLILRGDLAPSDSSSPTSAEAGAGAANGERAVRSGSSGSGDVALATAGVEDVRLLPPVHLEGGHSLEGTPGARYLSGLTQDGIALLDARLLFEDTQLLVQSE